jgi:hypothetical protein
VAARLKAHLKATPPRTSIFSRGVFLAMATSVRACRTLSTARSSGTARGQPRDLKAYQREANRLFTSFRRFVYAFYDPVFFEAFCSEDPHDFMRAASVRIPPAAASELAKAASE